MTQTFYETYWDGHEGELSDFKLKWPILSPLIPKKENIIILDFGCGNGQLILEMMKLNPRARFIGLDVSDIALQAAKKRISNVELLPIQDGGSFPVESGRVDFVFTSEVIEHVYDTENAISELSRILRKGGQLLLTTPYHGFLKNIALVLFGFDKHFNPTGPHVRFFSNKALFALLAKHGLRVLSHGYYGRFFPFSHSVYVLAVKE